jgi:hypothetical protein
VKAEHFCVPLQTYHGDRLPNWQQPLCGYCIRRERAIRTKSVRIFGGRSEFWGWESGGATAGCRAPEKPLIPIEISQIHHFRPYIARAQLSRFTLLSRLIESLARPNQSKTPVFPPFGRQ